MLYEAQSQLGIAEEWYLFLSLPRSSYIRKTLDIDLMLTWISFNHSSNYAPNHMQKQTQL